jgi:hypothetical protein
LFRFHYHHFFAIFVDSLRFYFEIIRGFEVERQ